jgi:DNA-binding transcriptional regulator YhcF (GntR family)
VSCQKEVEREGYVDVEGGKTLYITNTGNELLKYTNYLHQKETANAAKTIDEFLVKYYIKRDQYDFVYARISSFYYL